MAKTPSGTYVVANQTFMAGEGLRVRKGEIFAADDPLVVKLPKLFDPFEQRVRTTRQER